jgi:hypothetical protein
MALNAQERITLLREQIRQTTGWATKLENEATKIREANRALQDEIKALENSKLWHICADRLLLNTR